jgi:hypothetical protein
VRVQLVAFFRPFAAHTLAYCAGIEQVAWNPLSPQFFLASTENGEVGCFNAMQAGAVMWRLAAHNKECTGLAINPQVYYLPMPPGLSIVFVTLAYYVPSVV